MRRTLALLATAGLLFGPALAFAQAAPISRYVRYVGNMNFVATGGSLRTQSNAGNACAVGPTSTAALTGVPAGSTIVAAYLYWGGSGAAVDSSVSLNGAGVAANRTFTTTFNNGGTNFPFFGGFADVTAGVSGNGAFTFGGLTVATGAPHCGSQAVLAGWGLVVIYESAGEDLRAINVFDGLQFFRGSSLTLVPDGFRVPVSPINGRMSIVAWEGDPGNSTPLNGFAEALTFNGATLDDGILVPGSNPPVQPYDGTVNTLGVSTSYGADIDAFTVDPFIFPGQTTATTVFSAGGDLVLLTAQVVSVSSEPVVDLSLSKTHVGDFTAGTDGAYTLRVSNGSGVGVEPEDNPVTVTDTLPAGFNFVSGSGTGWNCGAVGQTVTCTHPPPLATGASLPDLTLTVLPTGAAAASVTNTATVSSASLDVSAADNTASDPTVVRFPDLSTSTKTVLDLNGGDANPGDTLRYTITLRESAGFDAPAAGVSDDIPANVSNFVLTTLPAGATDNSTGAGTGANGTGFLDVSSITVPASGSVTVVFEVQVAAGTPIGTTIDNTATVTNPNGPDAAPAAPQIVVSQSQIPASGSKPLYLAANALQLSRNPPVAPQATVTIGPNGSSTWVLNPALAGSLSLPAGNVPVALWLTESGPQTNRNIRVTLTAGAATLGVSAVTTVGPPAGNPQQFTIPVPILAATTIPAGTTILMRIDNTTFQPNRNVIVWPFNPLNATQRSNAGFTSNTVINVDSVQTFDAAFPGGAPAPALVPGATVFMRAVVSDPFGNFDIAGARLTLIDPNSTTVLNDVAMSAVTPVANGVAMRTYELSYAIPGGAPGGAWTVRVVATEGTEGTVTDLGIGTFSVVPPQPTLVVAKTSQVISDPFNNVTNPKRIPGSVQLYSVTVTNQGPGTVDASTLAIVDPVPPNSALYVSTASGDPIVFLDGSPASGLTFNYAAHVSFSNQPGGGAPFSYAPVPDANGFDPNVTGMRIAPAGTMNAAGAGNPSFTIRFRVRLQ